MAEVLTPDICVIGGGPAGIALATRAARSAVPVILVEKSRMGGANLAYGSIPSKALIAAAGHYEVLRHGPAFGVTGAPLQVNFGKVSEHIRSVADAVAPHVSSERLAALGVRVIAAPARFLDRRTVIAGEFTINARRFVLATGAVPAVPEIPGLAGIDYMTAESAFDITRKPSHLLVLGANSHALEIAQAYTRLGVDTTVIDGAPALPDDDPELAEVVLERLRAEGIRVRDRAAFTGIARRRGGIRVTIGEGEGEVQIDGSHLLVAAGRSPNVADLGLDAAGVAFDRDGVVVDRHLRTTNRRIYAIGDAVAGPSAVNRGDCQAERILRAILFRLPARDRSADASVVTFTDPGLARVGLGAAEALKRDAKVRILRFPFIENDRAQAERMPAGFIKVVTSRKGRILGAAIVGHDAGEQIALWSFAIANRLGIESMLSFVPPYPARAEISRRVAETFYGPGLTPGWYRRIIEFLRKFG
jgi:pyruvate/2-oxoglutarate dehydrogenase complex dihydrolipoamide dehydrogenase (E3) component